jgi:hypothetical protein
MQDFTRWPNHNIARDADESVPTTRCVVCLKTLPTSAFYAAQGFVGGRLDECKQCYGARVARTPSLTDRMHWKAAKELVQAHKHSPCADCGQRFFPAAMDFDHVPGRGKKLFSLSRVPRAADETMVRREMKKCDLVCSNCHRVRTSSRAGMRVGTKGALDILRGRLDRNPLLADMIAVDRGMNPNRRKRVRRTNKSK